MRISKLKKESEELFLISDSDSYYICKYYYHNDSYYIRSIIKKLLFMFNKYDCTEIFEGNYDYDLVKDIFLCVENYGEFIKKEDVSKIRERISIHRNIKKYNL